MGESRRMIRECITPGVYKCSISTEFPAYSVVYAQNCKQKSIVKYEKVFSFRAAELRISLYWKFLYPALNALLFFFVESKLQNVVSVL